MKRPTRPRGASPEASAVRRRYYEALSQGYPPQEAARMAQNGPQLVVQDSGPKPIPEDWRELPFPALRRLAQSFSHDSGESREDVESAIEAELARRNGDDPEESEMADEKRTNEVYPKLDKSGQVDLTDENDTAAERAEKLKARGWHEAEEAGTTGLDTPEKERAKQKPDPRPDPHQPTKDAGEGEEPAAATRSRADAPKSDTAGQAPKGRTRAKPKR